MHKPARLIVGVGIFALVVGCYWLWSAEWPTGLLSVPDEDLCFGTIWETDRLPWRIPVRNVSNTSLEIIGFSASCTCVSIAPEKLVLRTGEERDLDLVFDLSKSFYKKTESEVAFQIWLIPKVKGHGLEVVRWRIHGTIRKLLDITPVSIHFGGDLTADRPFPVRKLSARSAVPLNDLVVSASADSIRAVASKRSEKEFEVAVTPRPDLPSGPFSCQLLFQPHGRKLGERFPPKRLPVEGFVHPQVTAIPSSIRLGARAVGERLERTIRLVSRTGEPFTWQVKENSGLPPTLRVEKSSVDSFMLKVEVRGPAHSSHSHKVILQAQYGIHARAIEIAIPVSYIVEGSTNQ